MYSTCTKIFWYFLENAKNVSTLEKYAISLAKILAKHNQDFLFALNTFYLHSQYHVLYCYWTFRTYSFLWSNYENLDITWNLYIIPLCIDVLCTSSFWFHNWKIFLKGFYCLDWIYFEKVFWLCRIVFSSVLLFFSSKTAGTYYSILLIWMLRLLMDNALFFEFLDNFFFF